jgi:hypothetical protein
MTALQPSDRSRFKDASEAEQALREAWDRCLTQGLVHPAVLAMEEQPHDKVPARMHEVRAVPQRPQLAVPSTVSLLNNDSNEVTAIDAQMPVKALTIESKLPARIGDDDPTVLQVKGAEKDRPSGKARVLDVAKTRPDPSGPRRIDDAAPTQSDEANVNTSTIRRSSSGLGGSKLSLILALVIVVLIVTAASLFFVGVIRI